MVGQRELLLSMFELGELRLHGERNDRSDVCDKGRIRGCANHQPLDVGTTVLVQQLCDNDNLFRRLFVRRAPSCFGRAESTVTKVTSQL